MGGEAAGGEAAGGEAAATAWNVPRPGRPGELPDRWPVMPSQAPRPESVRRAAVVVAHPDDETLWCGGYILSHPEFAWRIVSLCRGSDPDRAPRFAAALHLFAAEGAMADLDDGPSQTPLPAAEVEEAIAGLLGSEEYDLTLTHGPGGEYTRHLRHEECFRSVDALWRAGRLRTRSLWVFAYEDGNRAYLPRVAGNANRRDPLPAGVWCEKRRIITDIYGYGAASWEARTTPAEEGFVCYDSPEEIGNRQP